MMTCDSNPGRGLRRYDAAAVMTDQIARQFRGLDEGITRGKLLAALKGAAQRLNIDAAIVHLVDVLFAYSRDVDWRSTQIPIVWPSNEELADKLGKSVRQIQNYLRRAQTLGLIAHRDSPNGHRGGARRPDETIIWAYGIVLSPIGVRYGELRAAATEAAAARRTVKALKSRLAAARRKIRCLAQTVVDNYLIGFNVDEDIALARMAAAQMKGERDPRRLLSYVKQIETRQQALEAEIADHLSHPASKLEAGYISCSHEEHSTHSTATNQLKTAKAEYSNSLADTSSGNRPSSHPEGKSHVEADLDKYGIGPAFIAAVANDLLPEFEFTAPTWGPMIARAERLSVQNAIHPSAWREACRVMGERGAAASVIATIRKFYAGEVQQPGAYLRGMTGKAVRGELRLGKTYRGFKEINRSEEMRSLASGVAPNTVGQLSQKFVAGLALRT